MWLGLVGAIGVLSMVAGGVWLAFFVFSAIGWVETNDPASGETRVEVAAAPSEPVVVPVQPPDPLPLFEPLGPNAGGEAEPSVGREEHPDRAELTVEGRPSGEVYIDGQYGGITPHTLWLPVGTYSVDLIAHDGRRKAYTVTVTVDDDDHKVRVVDRGTGKGKTTSFTGWDFDRRRSFR